MLRVQHIDARTLTPKQQETLRKTAVRMVYHEDYTQRAAANAIGVSRQEVCGWCRKYEKHGMSALDAKNRGRKAGEKTLLQPWQCSQIIRAITDKTPDQLKLPFVLWTRAAVRDYIEENSLTQLGGEITISAHSLGNMVVSSAITDHDAPIKHYMLFDAAVAVEAYQGDAPQTDVMSHPEWSMVAHGGPFPERTWSSEWYKLPWTAGDYRKKLALRQMRMIDTR